MSVFKTIWGITKHTLASTRYTAENKYTPALGTLYEQKVNDIDGKPFDLSKYKGTGTIILIINIASECGLTQCGYELLVEQYNAHRGQRFEILAVPCNQFGAQEPGTPDEIKHFARDTFKAEFPLLEKSDVNGPNTHPLYVWLKSSFPGDITWNFSGFFFVDENGVPMRRFTKEPYAEIRAFIERALKDRDAHEKAPVEAAAPVPVTAQ